MNWGGPGSPTRWKWGKILGLPAALFCSHYLSYLGFILCPHLLSSPEPAGLPEPDTSRPKASKGGGGRIGSSGVGGAPTLGGRQSPPAPGKVRERRGEKQQILCRPKSRCPGTRLAVLCSFLESLGRRGETSLAVTIKGKLGLLPLSKMLPIHLPWPKPEDGSYLCRESRGSGRAGPPPISTYFLARNRKVHPCVPVSQRPVLGAHFPPPAPGKTGKGPKSQSRCSHLQKGETQVGVSSMEAPGHYL